MSFGCFVMSASMKMPSSGTSSTRGSTSMAPESYKIAQTTLLQLDGDRVVTSLRSGCTSLRDLCEPPQVFCNGRSRIASICKALQYGSFRDCIDGKVVIIRFAGSVSNISPSGVSSRAILSMTAVSTASFCFTSSVTTSEVTVKLSSCRKA